jgi:hypothetical protein
MFTAVENPFGIDAFVPPASEQIRTTYYKGMRLLQTPAARLPHAPKPLSHHVKNFLLNYNG